MSEQEVLHPLLTSPHVAFACYWFRIRLLTCRPAEIQVQLRIIPLGPAPAAPSRPSHTTPAVVDGHVFGFGQSGLQCTKLDDGSLVWQERWQENRHLIMADGLLFASTDKGEIVMAEASADGFKELGRVETGLELNGSTQQMTLSAGRIYVRGKNNVACYDLVNPPE